MSNFEPIRKKSRYHDREKDIPVHLPMCGKKKSYLSRRKAEQTRQQLLQGGVASFLRVYRCPRTNCRYYHLTSKEQRRK